MTVPLGTRKQLAWLALTVGTGTVLCLSFYLVRESLQGLLWVALTAAIVTAAILASELRRVRIAKGLSDRANMAKTRFLANISQDIRTPMDGIVGMTDLLLLSGLAASQQEYAVTVQNSASALLKMLNEMLDYSRIIDGQVLFTNSDFELHELIDNVVERYASAALEKRIELTCHISPNVPEVVCGDPVRLQQVIDQLVSNGVKFTSQGRVCVFARWLGEQDADHLIQIEVRDTGVGIPERDHSKVFDSYAAVRSDDRQTPCGGIGLAIAKQIVTRAQGTIDFESDPGRGSTFWVVLPFGRSSIKVPERPKSSHLAGKHVVIASALECFCNMATDYCRSYGMTTIAVNSADKLAGALRRTEVVDLAIVDDEIARTAAKELRDVPVLVIPTSPGHVPEGYRVLHRPIRRRAFELSLLQVIDEHAGDLKLA